MRIAVIGATGMLGHHTAQAVVNAGHQLIVISRRPPKLSVDLVFEDRRADLDDTAALRIALQNTDAVINCAGYYPTKPRPWREEVETATRQMGSFYRACDGLPLEKIVYLGAAIALPRRDEGRPGDESLSYEHQPVDKNPYLQVKWALDLQARERARSGMPVTIGIPSMTFGEFDPGNTTGRFILETARRTLPGYVNGKRNVIYAGDAGRGLVKVCEKGRPGERYLLTGENLTMKQLMDKIVRITGAPQPHQTPLWLARLLASLQAFRYRYLSGPEPKITESAIAVMSSGQFLCGDKAKKELDFTAEVSIDEAIERTLGWFKSKSMV